MKKLFKVSLFTLMMVFCTLVANAQSVIINGNNVCIRSSATVNANNKIGHEDKGARFAYIGTYGSFYCINYYGTYGYVHKSYSYIEKQHRQAAAQRFAHITGNNVRIRSAASLNSKVVGSCNRGDYLVFLGYSGAFAKVKYGGRSCYVHRDYVVVE